MNALVEEPGGGVASDAARPTMTPRRRLWSSDTVFPLTPGPCWHRQPSIPVCRTRRDKGSVNSIDIRVTDMASTRPARIEPHSRGQVGPAHTQTA